MNTIESELTASMEDIFDSAGERVVYSPVGADEIALTAVRGSIAMERSGEQGRYLGGTAVRFIVWKRDLGVTPQLGDRITASDGTIYAVMGSGGKPHWEFADPYRKTVGIFAKVV